MFYLWLILSRFECIEIKVGGESRIKIPDGFSMQIDDNVSYFACK